MSHTTSFIQLNTKINLGPFNLTISLKKTLISISICNPGIYPIQNGLSSL